MSGTMEKDQFDDLGYSLSPQNVDRQFWYYEGKEGLTCVHQPSILETASFTIPWRMLDRTFERRQNAKLIKVAKRKSK